MEVKGKEFLRNVEIEKEKRAHTEQIRSLNNEKKPSVVKKNLYDDEPVVVDVKNSFNAELNDIKLDHNDNEEDTQTKKKYLMLTLALSILFILTIIIIRLMSNDTKDDNLFKTTQIEQDNILDAPDANDKYEAIINKKAKQTIQKKLDLEEIAKEEIPLPQTISQQPVEPKVKPKKEQLAQSDDIFGIEKQEVKKEVTKKVVKTVVKKPKTVVKPKVVAKKKAKQIKKSTSKKLTGNFIQIGAFTKLPNKTLLTKIKKAGYSYIIHKMTIKGRVYNKVLIGPYKGEAKSAKALKEIRKKLNKPSAYILRLK